ncbi:MAG: glucose-1-phosphate thymidylyltransferase [Dinghuibacter sp.]|nr:glucose-1-phosphate thymidylyltransferase [Dinghuibacter sp.]
MHLQIAPTTGNTTLWPFTPFRGFESLRTGLFTLAERCALLGIVLHTGEHPAPAENDIVITLPANQLVSLAGLQQLKETGQAPGSEHTRTLQHAAHLVQFNDWALRTDMDWILAHKASMPIPATVQTINPREIFIEPGARLQHCTINASNGPVYIGAHAEVMEGCTLRGPLVIGEGAVVKMGAKIYGSTTIGPYCMAGGEIKNSILMGFSNKAHDGYLGDAVLGEWCNLGAGTSNSNIKNTAGEILLYNGSNEPFTAGNKCGLMMGDFSRSAINTSFNTGAMVGVCCNIFGSGLTPKHTPDFRWGNETYRLEAALRDIGNWMALKGRPLTAAMEEQIRRYYQETVTHSS